MLNITDSREAIVHVVFECTGVRNRSKNVLNKPEDLTNFWRLVAHGQCPTNSVPLAKLSAETDSLTYICRTWYLNLTGKIMYKVGIRLPKNSRSVIL